MTDLDRAVRDMLHERARDIRDVPSRLLELEAAEQDETLEGPGVASAAVLDLGSRRPSLRRTWPLIAAAAAVAALVFGLLTLAGSGGRQHKSPVPASTPTVTRAVCLAHIPQSWARPVHAGAVTLNGLSEPSVAAVTANGGALLVYDEPTDPQDRSGEHLGYLAPGSATVRELGYFSVPLRPRGITSFGIDVDVDGATALVSVESGGHTASVRTIEAIDIATGQRRVLLDADSYRNSSIPTQAYALDGVAYWQTDGITKRVPDRIYARSLDGSGPARVVTRAAPYDVSSAVDLESSAAGINWSLSGGNTIDRPAAVPAIVARHAAMDTFDTFDSYVTDGTAYAWQTEAGALEWWSPGAGHVVQVPRLLGRPYRGSQGAIFAVAGPLVYFQTRNGKSDRVLDTRTGAELPVPVQGGLEGSHGTEIGTTSLLPSSDKGGFGDISRVDTAELPAAPC